VSTQELGLLLLQVGRNALEGDNRLTAAPCAAYAARCLRKYQFVFG